MRKIRFIAVAALMAMGTSAFAQFTNVNSSGTTAASGSKGWNSFYLQWNPSEIKYDVYSYDFTGLTLGLNRFISLAPSIPIFLEAGGAIQYSYGDKNHYQINALSFKVPLNLTYNWQVSNVFAIAPYAGLTARINAWGRYKYKDDDYYYGESKGNLFSSDEGGAKRFQVGWQAGANFKFNKVYIGASYGTDFNKFDDGDGKIHTTSVTLGFIF